MSLTKPAALPLPGSSATALSQLFPGKNNGCSGTTRCVPVSAERPNPFKPIPMRKFYFIVCLLLAMSFANAQVSVTATAGTTGPTAYTTLKGAFDAVNAGTHRGVVTISINGNTTETATATLNASGSGSANYTSVLVRAGAGATPTVSGAITSGPVVRLNGSNNVTIEGSNNATTSRNLTITNTSATSSNVLQVGSVGTTPIDNVTVRNTILVNGTNTSTAVVVGDAAIVGNPGYYSDITFRNNDIRKAYIGLYLYAVVSALNNNVLVTGNSLNSTGANAIRLVGVYAQGLKGLTISNNDIGNFEATSPEFDRAIWLATATSGATISGNTISGMAYTGTSSYAPIGLNISSGITNSNITVTNNTITGLTSSGSGTTMGMYLYSAMSGVTVSRNQVSNIKNTNTGGFGSCGIIAAPTINTSAIKIVNNFVWDVASYGFNGYDAGDNGNGIVVDGGGGVEIDFNTVAMNTNQTLNGAHRASCLLITANVTASNTISVRNNIFANLQTLGNANSRLCISNLATSGAAVFANINRNDYYATSANLSSTGTNASITGTIAQLQTSLGGNANSVNIQPVFVGPNDLHLDPGANATLNNLGSPLAGITTDIDGDTRHATTPDMGADEFQPCPPITFTTQPVNAVICVGRDTSFRVVATGGAGYRWQVNTGSGFTNITNNAIYSGATTNTLVLTNPPATYSGYIYRCQVTSPSGGCPPANSNSVTLTVNSNPVAVITPASSPVICGGSSVLLNATPAGLTYEWQLAGNPIAAATNISYAATTAGNYTVYVTNPATTCSDTSDVLTVTVNPVINVAQNIVICASQLPYTWNAQTITAGGAAVATYTTASTVTGCDSTTTLNLSVNPVITATANISICQNQLPYTWNGQTITAGGTAVATYTMPSAVSSCDSTTTLNLAVNPLITATQNITICSNQLPYTWNGQTITTAGNAVATYTVPSTVTGCDSTTTLNLIVSSGAVAIATPASQSICSGNSTGIALSGADPGTNFTWTVTQTGASGATAGSGASIAQSLTATGATAGTVTYTITPDVSGCAGASISVAITVNPRPAMTATPAAPAICSGTSTSIALAANVSGTTYSWTAAQTNASGAGPGNGSSIAQLLTATTAAPGSVNYSITPSAGGCDGAPVATTIAVNPRPVMTATPAAPIICSGTATNIALSANVSSTTYSWTVAQNNTTGATAGTGTSIAQTVAATTSTAGTAVYTITPSASGCDGATATSTVTVNPLPVATANPVTTAICSGTATNISLSANVSSTTYSWTAAQTNASGGSAGSGTSINQTLTATGPTPGTVIYTITPAANGCPGAAIPAAATVNPLPVMTAAPVSAAICSGTTASIALSSSITGTTYNWTVVQSDVSGAVAGSGTSISQTLIATNTVAGTATYTITPVLNGCPGTPVTTTITVNPSPKAIATPFTQAICSGSTAHIALSADIAGTTYTWTATANNVTGAADGSGNAIAQTLATGSFTGSVSYLIIPEAGGCAGDPVIATAVVHPLPIINITKSNDLDCNYSDTRLVASGARTYTWSPVAGLSDPSISNPVAGPTVATTYTVTGTDINGCVNTASILVDITNTRQGDNLVPNAFTPNGDGKNDCFGIKFWGVIDKMEMVIYNRGGEKVYQSNLPNACWDGRYKGQPQNTGVFIYYIRASTNCGIIERKGTVTLIR